MSTVSIIVPVYRVEKELERCISSVLAQSFGDFELILVNDGSPDGSGAICSAAAERDNRIRYFEKTNGGLASARNYGLERATGEFICFVDSDDYIDSGCLKYCLNAIKEADADMVICGYLMEVFGKTSQVFAAPAVLNSDNINSAIIELKRKNLIDPAWNKLYRRSFIENNNLRFPEGEIYEDTDFNLRALRFSPKIAVRDRCFYHYELHMGSITRRYNPEKLSTIKQRALLLMDVTSGIDGYCSYYYIKSVLSAVIDMFLSCKKNDIKRTLRLETADPVFKTAAKNADGGAGVAAVLTVAAAKSNNPVIIYIFCRLVYFLKFKLQRIFLKVRE